MADQPQRRNRKLDLDDASNAIRDAFDFDRCFTLYEAVAAAWPHVAPNNRHSAANKMRTLLGSGALRAECVKSGSPASETWVLREAVDAEPARVVGKPQKLSASDLRHAVLLRMGPLDGCSYAPGAVAALDAYAARLEQDWRWHEGYKAQRRAEEAIRAAVARVTKGETNGRRRTAPAPKSRRAHAG